VPFFHTHACRRYRARTRESSCWFLLASRDALQRIFVRATFFSLTIRDNKILSVTIHVKCATIVHFLSPAPRPSFCRVRTFADTLGAVGILELVVFPKNLSLENFIHALGIILMPVRVKRKDWQKEVKSYLLRTLYAKCIFLHLSLPLSLSLSLSLSFCLSVSLYSFSNWFSYSCFMLIIIRLGILSEDPNSKREYVWQAETLYVNLYPKLLALRFCIGVKGMKDRWNHYGKYLLPVAAISVSVIVVKSDRRRIYPFVTRTAYGTGDKLLIIITFLPARIMMTDLSEVNTTDYADAYNMEIRVAGQ
jgi:hypothetical protein